MRDAILWKPAQKNAQLHNTILLLEIFVDETNENSYKAKQKLIDSEKQELRRNINKTNKLFGTIKIRRT